MKNILNQQSTQNEQAFYYPEDLTFDAMTQNFIKSTPQQHYNDSLNTKNETQTPNTSLNSTSFAPFSTLLGGNNDAITSLLAGNLLGTNSPKNEYLSQALKLLNSQKPKQKKSEATSLTINQEDISQSFEEK